MLTGFLPRNPSRNDPSGSELSFTARKLSTKLKSRPINDVQSPRVAVHSTPSNNSIASRQYENERQQRLIAAQRDQRAWYETVSNEAFQQRALNREQGQLARDELHSHVESERRAGEELRQQQVGICRAKLHEREEQRRREGERIRQERAEAEATLLAVIAAEQEEERRQAEEAERLRRDRLRECTVCFDADDMGVMVELACTHWYCRPHLRGSSSPCSQNVHLNSDLN
ncbi:uncharacterized protein KY384_005341 [Bacidia gigantensis]|uniref:uncharacterized protein n=1 Tax=Bacidia gigantensis TaxID=2732470 RepID=UPI001D05307C|nr:uncharacterized protein KY384_005341 [Bacidia gigantensis]KAG8529860.1 hypothetical protein KY384_005341 [Bacidia gigantensis]